MWLPGPPVCRPILITPLPPSLFLLSSPAEPHASVPQRTTLSLSSGSSHPHFLLPPTLPSSCPVNSPFFSFPLQHPFLKKAFITLQVQAIDFQSIPSLPFPHIPHASASNRKEVPSEQRPCFSSLLPFFILKRTLLFIFNTLKLGSILKSTGHHNLIVSIFPFSAKHKIMVVLTLQSILRAGKIGYVLCLRNTAPSPWQRPTIPWQIRKTCVYFLRIWFSI